MDTRFDPESELRRPLGRPSTAIAEAVCSKNYVGTPSPRRTDLTKKRCYTPIWRWLKTKRLDDRAVDVFEWRDRTRRKFFEISQACLESRGLGWAVEHISELLGDSATDFEGSMAGARRRKIEQAD